MVPSLKVAVAVSWREVPEQVGLLPLVTSKLTKLRLELRVADTGKSEGDCTLPLLLTQLRELVTLPALTAEEEASALKPKFWPTTVITPSVQVALRSSVALEPSL